MIPLPTKQRAALLVLLAALGGPTLALSQTVTEVVVSPPDATFLDLVHVTVRGTGADCGLHLGTPDLRQISFGVFTVDFPIEGACGVPTGAIVPFEAGADLDHLAPGVYTLTIAHANEQTFSVVLPAFERMDPPTLSTTSSPGTVRVHGLRQISNLPSTAAVSVDGTRVDVHLTPGLPFLSPSLPYFLPFTLDVPLPPLPAGKYEVRLRGSWRAGIGDGIDRAELRVWDATRCIPADDALCLLGGRFRVTGSWRTPSGATGVAHARSLDDDGSGLLWFFDRDNPELTAKALDACGLDGHRWLFLASGSNVEYRITVTDTVTGAVRSYANPQGTLPPLVADTSAFDCAAP